MTHLDRSRCQVLTLIMKGKWYDMVASGEKKEEYREFKPYYETRVHNWMQRLDYEGGFAIIEMRRG